MSEELRRDEVAQIQPAEAIYAWEAAAHAAAAAELNPHGEAEAIELGTARAVYAGQWSPVHGVYGLGLDGPVEERDLREIERFFFRKERPASYWITPATDPSLLELLGRDFAPTRRVAVHGGRLPLGELPAPAGDSSPDHRAWSLAFTRVLDPGAQEPGLHALIKLHQKETRFYLGSALGSRASETMSASYTFFRNGVALAPVPSAHSLLALQVKDALDYKCSHFFTSASPLPKLYERVLHERL